MQGPSYDTKEVLTEPFDFLLQVPGKNVRGKLISAFNLWLQLPETLLEKIEQVVAILHNSSLLIDDIEDNSKLRRGLPVAHQVYGIPATINCANYMYFEALQLCSSLKNHDANAVFLEEMINLHHGQGFDIFWRDHQICPTEEEYKKMVIDKTGGLFRLAVKMMQSFSENENDYIPLVNKLALYFQIRDDYVNLQSAEFMDNKGFCEDITEGKFSFPIIHSIRSNLSDHRLLGILKQRTTDVELKKYVVKYIEQTGSFEYTRKEMDKLYLEIEKEIESLGGNAILSKLMVLLSKYGK